MEILPNYLNIYHPKSTSALAGVNLSTFPHRTGSGVQTADLRGQGRVCLSTTPLSPTTSSMGYNSCMVTYIIIRGVYIN